MKKLIVLLGCSLVMLSQGVLAGKAAGDAATKVYDIEAQVDCFSTDQGQPVCNLLMGSDDLAKYWGDDVANAAVAIGLTEDPAGAAKLGFTPELAVDAQKTHCRYQAGVKIKARKGKLDEDESGYYPSFKLVEVMGRNDFQKVCADQ
jgi:hypothetical protein